MKNFKTQLTLKELQTMISALSMTIAAIDTAEQKEVYIELYKKLSYLTPTAK